MSDALRGRCVVLGITGGIAAYKAADLVSRLRKAGAEVNVIMTRNATQFITPLTLETLSAQSVVVDTFERPERREVEHVALAKKADLFVVAPATANVLAKMAHGLADDMLTTTLLAFRGQVLCAPAMNSGMYLHPATQDNLEILRKRGVRFVGPEGGRLACGDDGIGRMSEPQTILQACEACLNRERDMEGLRVLVTAGGTREYLDPVRYLSNESSGRMGFALAAAAMERGAEVTLVKAFTTAEKPPVSREISVKTTLELYEVMMRECPGMDVIIQAAAPADYRFRKTYSEKVKKTNGQELVLEMEENPDVARAVGEGRRTGQTLVGFAAETGNLLENARKKLHSKHLDLVVANDVSLPGAGFGTETNIATMIFHGGERELTLRTKDEMAENILDQILEIRRGKKE